LFDKIRFGHVWENQNTFSKNRLTFSVNKKLKEDYIKFWKDKLFLDGSEEKGNKNWMLFYILLKYILQIFLAPVLVEIKNVSTQHLYYLSTMSLETKLHYNEVI
jgi:hypothetical protein